MSYGSRPRHGPVIEWRAGVLRRADVGEVDVLDRGSEPVEAAERIPSVLGEVVDIGTLAGDADAAVGVAFGVAQGPEARAVLVGVEERVPLAGAGCLAFIVVSFGGVVVASWRLQTISAQRRSSSVGK